MGFRIDWLLLHLLILCGDGSKKNGELTAGMNKSYLGNVKLVSAAKCRLKGA
jgi:hypothetical protein